ncbi:hypothetical protein [Nannocystis pusilla]|uniref:Uncharacterized protein n=1 Tax=Nannocystis pusilla TaxID=889268 RepID=A0ABS7TV23_9BACT|nr:hypothetical protein [Nannocystis pusilla]MBZ5712094.1 hypothetical protein [Nannocystis pusilla]
MELLSDRPGGCPVEGACIRALTRARARFSRHALRVRGVREDAGMQAPAGTHPHRPMRAVEDRADDGELDDGQLRAGSAARPRPWFSLLEASLPLSLVQARAMTR